MRKTTLLILIFVGFFNISAQRTNPYHDFSERGEVYFSFQIEDFEILNQLTLIISIDRVDKNGQVTAYANEEEFAKFLEFEIKPTVLTPPSMLEEHVMLSLEDFLSKKPGSWDFYPSYEAYIAMMDGFQANFPALCQIVEFGTSQQGRKLLTARLTSSLNPNTKAKVHFSSTMHGDEVTGFVLMLRLIDYLLNQYAINPRVQHLLDHAEVWISPNANPDGTYRTGNSTVTGATRGNANGVDLNRNFKDNIRGDHPDGRAWQPETLAFKALQAEQNFHLGMNIHGGAEVVNYPWDNRHELAADNNWWIHVSQQYVDTARRLNSNYMRDVTQSGITNGAAWYVVFGSRQDYANYYDNTREFCLEISNTKTPTASQLPTFWNYNYRSFLN